MPDVKRFCEFNGCCELAEKGCHYCKKHMEQVRKQRALVRNICRKTPYERGYDSRWAKARKIFLAQHPLCAVCGAPATDVDHIIPHKGKSACSGINPTGRRSAIRAIREKLPARTWAAGKILAGRGRGVKNQHLQRKSTAAQNLRKRVFISGGRVILWEK